MARSLFYRLLIIIIGLINGLYLLILCTGLKKSLIHRYITDPGAVPWMIGNPLRQNIHGTLNGSFQRFHSLFL